MAVCTFSGSATNLADSRTFVSPESDPALHNAITAMHNSRAHVVQTDWDALCFPLLCPASAPQQFTDESRQRTSPLGQAATRVTPLGRRVWHTRTERAPESRRTVWRTVCLL